MGTADLGAYECQAVQPLALNSYFDADVHLRTPVFAGVASRDSSSIAVILVAVEGGASADPRTTHAWFDGGTLEILGDDTIFADGFDPPP
jgi:hypothetical protein